MAAVAAGDIYVYEQETGPSPIADSPFQNKEIIVETADTVDSTNTIAVDVSLYGISTIRYIKGLVHTVDAMALEAPTTTVSGTTITITVGGSSADNLKRTYLIGGY